MSAKGTTLTRLLLAFLSCALIAVAASAARLALAPGDVAPEMRGNRVDNSFVAVNYAASKLTLINFWASWCEPCKEEMPALQALWEKHREQGLTVVGAFHDAAPNETLLEFVDGLGVTYLVLRPRDGVTERWGGARILPLTYLVDSEGKILRRYVGATPEQIDGLAVDVAAALEGKQLGPLVIPEKPAVAGAEERKKAQSQ